MYFIFIWEIIISAFFLFVHNWHQCNELNKINWFDIIVDSQTALHHAARNGHLRCLKVLLDHGAIVDVKNNEGKTAMQIALDKGEYDCARYLKTVQGIEHYFLSDSGTYCVY